MVDIFNHPAVLAFLYVAAHAGSAAFGNIADCPAVAGHYRVLKPLEIRSTVTAKDFGDPILHDGSIHQGFKRLPYHYRPLHNLLQGHDPVVFDQFAKKPFQLLLPVAGQLLAVRGEIMEHDDVTRL